jgi:hypothetical protein
LSRRFLVFLSAVGLYLPLLLLADSPGAFPQLALGAATAGFLYLFARRGPIPPGQLVTTIIVATVGECVLSLGWGLYSYQNALIPLYVPFGHGIFYALAAESARQPALQRMEPAITRGVLTIGTVIAGIGLAFFHDQWGFLWWIIAATLVFRSHNRLLLSTCFIYTILLEWLGTAIGNWRWAAEVPFVGLTSANPPSGVGVLYILLDLIVIAITVRRPTADAETPLPARPPRAATALN